MEPYEKGQECFRLARNSNKSATVKKVGGVRLKSDLRNMGGLTNVSDRTSNVSVNESHQHQIMRNSDYSNGSSLRQPWVPPQAKTSVKNLAIAVETNVRKHTSSKELAKSSL